MTVEPFISRVYAFLIFPCASVVSYALPPTSIRSYDYQTCDFIILIDTRLPYVRNNSKRRMLNFRNGCSYESQTCNGPLAIV